ncbi:integrator complex subunit 11-like [Tropilaelaps mercedesae]|uniref:Integrator complex subunit 11-like n=1 Tax=Tropilaelaps mercedesae TaxID=418985 RepID=A0A1V9X9B6_9ACAR|nr:integrator complex subunit 11-like [Tropilaelaps mercedesae]
MPGYCVSGTVGAKILNGVRRVEIDKGNFVSAPERYNPVVSIHLTIRLPKTIILGSLS